MKYLVDANILSEATKAAPHQRVIEWLRAHEARLVVNPVILGELEYGILQLVAGKKRRDLEEWFARISRRIPVVDIDAETGRIWAALLARLKRAGRAMPLKDSLIAASAVRHAMTVATRNTADFRHSGARVINPFSWGA